jgi:hypothetical protein
VAGVSLTIAILYKKFTETFLNHFQVPQLLIDGDYLDGISGIDGRKKFSYNKCRKAIDSKLQCSFQINIKGFEILYRNGGNICLYSISFKDPIP